MTGELFTQLKDCFRKQKRRTATGGGGHFVVSGGWGKEAIETATKWRPSAFRCVRGTSSQVRKVVSRMTRRPSRSYYSRLRLTADVFTSRSLAGGRQGAWVSRPWPEGTSASVVTVERERETERKLGSIVNRQTPVEKHYHALTLGSCIFSANETTMYGEGHQLFG